MRRVILSMIAGLMALPVAAQEVTQIPNNPSPESTPGLAGAFRAGNSPYAGADAYLDVVPLFIYEGKYFFSRGTVFGGHLFRNESFSFDLIARYRFDWLDPGASAELAGMTEREQTWEGGISGTARGGWGQLKLDYVTDLRDRHDGEELDLTYRYNFDLGDWQVSPFVTFAWLDEDITGYYYGVSPGEAVPGRPAYTPGDALNVEIGLNTWYQITDHVFMFANIGVKGFDSTIKNSPIVAEDTITTAFVGAGYLFGNTRTPKYVDAERMNEWSWGVNYGYAAEKNIFPYLMSGQIQKSTRADTNIAGFTLGKLLQGGRRADFYGKVSLYRHLEEPYQEDFWSFAAYIQAMGKAYSPWSKKLIFRYGFGFGFSYASEIPMVEQLKQEAHSDNTSHLLNYLEFKVDFPIDRLIESKLTKNCFLGMTAVHRSGIFATSDVLGSVSGGSDWVTLSYECLR